MVLKILISEIESFVIPELLIHTKVDDVLLQDLHHEFHNKGYAFDAYHSTLVAMGLLSLYIDCHNQIKITKTHDQLSTLILKGDYFYSLYYQYCAQNAFHLIAYNFAKKIKEAEIASLSTPYPSLLQETITLFEQEVSHYELFS